MDAFDICRLRSGTMCSLTSASNLESDDAIYASEVSLLAWLELYEMYLTEMKPFAIYRRRSASAINCSSFIPGSAQSPPDLLLLCSRS